VVGLSDYTLNKEMKAIISGKETLGNSFFKENLWREAYLEGVKRQLLHQSTHHQSGGQAWRI
jgi:hypothetical protein